MGPVSSEYSTIGPGFAAFVVVFALAVALWFLVRNMNGRLRAIAYREQADAEAAEHDADGAPAASEHDPTTR